ncbi:MAG: tRNA uridine-5-carboxymethylaminomethyl(34) synthesis GTPase MnmE [Candidatus Marinimicrobia bacterium]|nr:tRNA uridine-5-carboxymethylaminomethyl(34) synthesis GTPase MnmE [Candidatus Neomarinimicrobiota bacterium]
MITTDTIIAPATAVGEGGIAVVRISGPQSLSALQKHFSPTAQVPVYRSHQLYHGILTDQLEQHIDEVMAVYMAAPHTYTRDDVVEIHCHGSQQVVKAILNLYLKFGLRLAQAGEFTYRAFINGRLDLSQSEAVAQLIHAKSDSSRRLALSQVEGLLSRTIHAITKKLRNIQILLEAWIDFPEEDLPVEDLLKIQQDIKGIVGEIVEITDSYNSGRVLLEGASILLVGRPNVGKSSLLNSLLGEERAIVTEVPGTTRDLLEEGVTISGVPVRLVDSAGLRKSADLVEREGVRRAKQKIEHADLILYLVDGSMMIDEQDLYAYRACKNYPAFLVRTKQDLPQIADTSFCTFSEFSISTKDDIGLTDLRTAIAGFLLGEHLPSSETVFLTEQRHYDALLAAQRNLEKFLETFAADQPLEFLVFELREALYFLGQISGETTSDSVLEGIFSQFCVGK